jgi:hypothetical protein
MAKLGMRLSSFLREFPHNTQLSEKHLADLIAYCHWKSKKDSLSREEFVEECLSRYGRNIADSLVDFLNNM